MPLSKHKPKAFYPDDVGALAKACIGDEPRVAGEDKAEMAHRLAVEIQRTITCFLDFDIVEYLAEIKSRDISIIAAKATKAP